VKKNNSALSLVVKLPLLIEQCRVS
jgi:hypothetical protein